MAENKDKSSKIIFEMIKRTPENTGGMTPDEFALMGFNARRYGKTDAEVEENILGQLFNDYRVRNILKGGKGKEEEKRKQLEAQFPGEWGKTKVLNAKNVLTAMGATVPGKDDHETPEQKLVRLYDENPNRVRNRVRMDKDLGAQGAYNLDALVESARNYTPKKPKVSVAHKIAGTVLYPRSLESMEAGRPVSGKDIGLDVAEDLLMAAPLGWGAGAFTRGANVGKRVASGIIANAIVPTGMEGLDAAVYKPEENLDRSVFQPTDAAMGTVTNLTAPYMLNRITGRGGRILGFGKEMPELKTSQEASNILKSWLDEGAFKRPGTKDINTALANIEESISRSRTASAEYQQALKLAEEFDKGVVNEATMKGKQIVKSYEDLAKEWREKASVIAGFMKAGNSYEDALLKANTLGNLSKEITGELPSPQRFKDILFDKAMYPELGKQAAVSFGVNRYGNQRNANMGFGLADQLLAGTDISLQDLLEEYRDSQSKDARNEYRKNMAKRVLEGLGTTDQSNDSTWANLFKKDPSIVDDENAPLEFKTWWSMPIFDDSKMIQLIKDNPSIVNDKDAPAAFKNWWNTRGMQLFGGDRLFGGSKD